MHATLPLLEVTDFPALRRSQTDTLQVNLGYECNQTCVHCHVNAGPNRTERLSDDLIELIPKVLKVRNISHLDLTGGAPEMHSGFRELVTKVRALGVKVIDRCNLTILLEPGYETLAEFLAKQGVEIVASLPCYSVENVDRQRGKGTFDKSIEALQRLNTLGYGKKDSGLLINLVYNPQGPTLPPDQAILEQDYKRELKQHFGIEFNQLFAVTNMPIQRFGSMLVTKNQFAPYMQLLKDHYKPQNLASVMCRSLISVDWEGYLYDCDFNQQLNLPMGGRRRRLEDLLDQDVDKEPICVADHCYGCTAGQGSSCGGALD
jgi:radical SAM/Cys-rich protein